jgi:hypothetical protein
MADADIDPYADIGNDLIDETSVKNDTYDEVVAMPSIIGNSSSRANIAPATLTASSDKTEKFQLFIGNLNWYQNLLHKLNTSII